MVEELTCQNAYNDDESYAKRLDEYFCETLYKNQQYYKTHENTYYDVVRYMKPLRVSGGGTGDTR